MASWRSAWSLFRPALDVGPDAGPHRRQDSGQRIGKCLYIGFRQVAEQAGDALGVALAPGGERGPALVGHRDQGHSAVGRVRTACYQAALFKPLNKLGHRWLGYPLSGSQRRDALRTLPIKRAERRHGGQAQVTPSRRALDDERDELEQVVRRSAEIHMCIYIACLPTRLAGSALADGAEQAIAAALPKRANLGEASRAQRSDLAGRLGVCTAERCDRVYVDTSKNGTRRFCSTACQNRVKAAAFRARHA